MLKDSNIQFVTNQQGEKVSILLPIKEWNSLMAKLEMLEDVQAFDDAMALNEKPVSFEDAKKILSENG